MRYHEARSRADGLLARIRASTGHRKRDLVTLYFKSRAARFRAAYKVLGAGADKEVASALVEQVNPFVPCRQVVEWWHEPKRTPGGYRVVCALPRPLRAANYMIKMVLEAVFEPGPHLYAWRGRGRDREASDIKRVLDRGYEYAFVADVRSCFDSVQPDALYGLPLPRTVIQCVLDHRSMTFRRNRRKEAEAICAAGIPATQIAIADISSIPRNGPRGLLQGSPSSNCVIARLFNELPATLRRGGHLFVNSDNVLVLTRTKAACRQAQRALFASLAEHRAGPFRLEGELVQAGTAVLERLGYAFEKTIFGFEINPSARNVDRLGQTVEEAKQEDLDAGRTEPENAARVLRERLSGFAAMTDRDGYMDGFIDAMRLELGRDRRKLLVQLRATLSQRQSATPAPRAAQKPKRLRRIALDRKACRISRRTAPSRP